MTTGIHVGTIVDKASLEPLTDAIVRIIETRADQETIRAGLRTLTCMAEVKSITIRDCQIYSGDVGIKQESPLDDVVTDESDDDRA